MFEHRSQPLLSRRHFGLRLVRAGLVAVGVIAGSLLLGILGYHETEKMGWIDATLNAAMILTGMGPVTELHTDAGKLFAAAYALFSGIIFLTLAAVLFAPVVHRLLHRFHFQIGEDEDDEAASPPSPSPRR